MDWKYLNRKVILRAGRIAGISAIGIVLIFILLACNVEKILYQPPKPQPGQTYQMLKAGDRRIAVLYLPGKKDSDVILYSHGNAEDLSTVQYVLKNLQLHGYSVIGYDYEGYGASEGTPTSETACRDADAVYHYLTDTLNILPEKIVIYGFSVGTGASCYLAEKYPAKALILEAPFASAYQVVLPIAGLPGDRLPNAERVAKTDIPLLVFHGERDLIIPFRNGQKVFAGARNRKKFVAVPKAGHNNIKECLGNAYWKHLSDFLNPE